MNRQRREKLDKAIGLINEADSIIADVLGEEQEAFDNMPESLQEADAGQAMQEAISALEEAQTGIEDVISNIETGQT